MPDELKHFGESLSFYDSLTEEQKSIVHKASELAMEKQKNEGVPFPFGIFHPEVLNLLQSALNTRKEDADAPNP